MFRSPQIAPSASNTFHRKLCKRKTQVRKEGKQSIFLYTLRLSDSVADTLHFTQVT